MEKTRVLWSGLTGRTGREAMSEVKKMDDVEIVGGISRHYYDDTDFEVLEMSSCADGLYEKTRYEFKNLKWYMYDDIANPLKVQPKGFDVIVDFSHPDCFGRVVELAVRTHVPLISGTSGLSNRQMAMLYDATSQISVFRGGNFRFKVKAFIDEAVEYAKGHNCLLLNERHWLGQPLPSEATKRLRQAIKDATGQSVATVCGVPYASDSLVNEWTLESDLSDDAGVSCRTEGFAELAHDVLRIAALMPKVPRSPGHLWSLDEIWDGLKVDA